MYQSARISVSGFIGRDPASPIASSPNYITFSLGMTKKVKDVSNTTWFECYTNNIEVGNYIRDKLKKGMGVQVHGIFSTNSYTSKTGEIKNTLRVYISSREGVEIHMYKTSETDNSWGYPETPVVPKKPIENVAPAAKNDAPDDLELDDEIPF